MKFEMKKLNITLTPQVITIAVCITKYIMENNEDYRFVNVGTSEPIIFASSIYTGSRSTSGMRELR
jgi:hypothetical protein